MSRIHILDPATAAKIAAGEVIERPVSVVKELLENAIDAGARHITAELLDGGLRQILIIDDGSGMSREDLPLAFERHATSKIDHFNDLFALHSFGFRGEALASIASIAQCECLSGQGQDVPAWRLVYEADGTTRLDEAAPMQGTRMLVKNLFYNVPARRKFMKSISHEYHLIYDLIARYALAYPEITFKIEHQRELTFTTVGREGVPERMIYCFGEELREALLHLEKTEIAPNTYAEAWMTTSVVSRNSRSQETFFVNGRLVMNRELSKLVDEAYATYLPKGRFPVLLLALEVPTESLDVNIHPAKTIVQMHQEMRWREALLDGIRDLLWQSDVAVPFLRQLRGSDEGKAEPREERTEAEEAEEHVDERQEHPSPATPDPLFSGLRPAQRQTLPFFEGGAPSMHTVPSEEPLQNVSEPALAYRTEPIDAPSAASPAHAPISLNEMAGLSLIGQLNNTFILAQDEEALYLIDQHTCHERILYERYMKAESAKTIHVQRFLMPYPLTLSPEEEGALEAYILQLRDLGIIIESGDAPRQYALLGLPAVLHEIRDYGAFLKDLLAALQEKPHLDLADIREELVTTASCKHAVKAHWPLTKDEMYRLVRDLKTLDNPHTCPHGRPIIVKITMNDLYLRFQRGSY